MKKFLKKTKNNMVEFASLIGGIIIYKLVGLMGIVGIGIGYGIYIFLYKKKISKIISITSGIIGGIIGYFIIITIYFNNIN
ncbi:hypothetical protein OAU30_00825 [Candidatus Pelagibacter sp.]|nr:hypothetical protein [Candidatus Pelagibacter sp.]